MSTTQTVRELYLYGSAILWPARPSMLSGRDLDTYTDLRLLAPYVRERLASMDEASARAELDSICGSLQVLCETDK